MAQFTDETPMPIGTHKGKPMSEVPDDYLRWFWNENREQYLNDEKLSDVTKSLMDYIEDNLDSIEVED